MNRSLDQALVLLQVFGAAKYCLIGESNAELRQTLREKGFVAEVVSHAEFPIAASSFQKTCIFVALDTLSSEEDALNLISRLEKCAPLFVCLRNSASSVGSFKGILWWEKRLLKSSFRKHPLHFILNRPETLSAGNEDFLILQSLTAESSNKEAFQGDVLRISNPQSTLMASLYAWISKFVRPDDRILELGSGCGVGSEFLHRLTGAAGYLGVEQRRTAVDYSRTMFDRAGLEFKDGKILSVIRALPSASAGFVVYGIQEGRGFPDSALMTEIQRVLTASGRCIFQVAGLHAQKVSLGKGMEIEKYLHQKLDPESGSFKLFETENLPPNLDHDESVLVMAMNCDFGSTQSPVPESIDGPKVSAFGYYENPVLFRAIGWIGRRTENAGLRSRLSRQTIENGKVRTADYGLSLCLEIYSILNQIDGAEDRFSELEELSEQYLTLNAGTSNPHILRWKVSIAFAMGLTRRNCGRTEESEKWFQRCIAFDALLFSPLLLTKTIDACYFLGLLRMARGDQDGAEQILLEGMMSAKKAMSADWEEVIGGNGFPAPIGLREMRDVFAKAERCATILANLQIGRSPFDACRDLIYTPEQALEFYSNQTQQLRAHIEFLEQPR